MTQPAEPTPTAKPLPKHVDKIKQPKPDDKQPQPDEKPPKRIDKPKLPPPKQGDKPAPKQPDGKDEKKDETEQKREQTTYRKQKRKRPAEEQMDPLTQLHRGLLKLPCQKHLLSNVTAATEKDGVSKTGVGSSTAFTLLYKVGKGFRDRSAWGRGKGKHFIAYCRAQDVENHLQGMRPVSDTRHHQQWQSFVKIYLSADALRGFIEQAATTAKRGAAIAAGEVEANTLNR